MHSSILRIVGIILLFWMTVFIQPAFCRDQPVSYTLLDLYRLALHRSEQIDIAREEVAIAEQTRKMALSVLLPSLSTVGNFRGYSEKRIVGGSVVQPNWTGSYGIQAGQRVTLNGRELTALRIAEAGIEKKRYDLQAVTENYLFNVASAFYDLAKSRKVLDIATANVRRLNVHRKAVALKMRLSEVPKTEIFRTDAELAKAETDRIRAENGCQLARTALARLVGLEGAFDIIADSQAVLLPPDSDFPALKTLALARRPELKSLVLQEQIAEKQIQYARGAFWPTVGWEGAWMRLEQDPDPANDESLYAGIRFTFEFFDGGLRRARVIEARSLRRQAELVRSDTARQVTVEVEQAWLELNTRKSVIASLESQLRYAGENFEAVTQLFKHGMANSVDVMDANTLLVTAERQLSEARFDLQLAALGLERATGTFLGRIRAELHEGTGNGAMTTDRASTP